MKRCLLLLLVFGLAACGGGGGGGNATDKARLDALVVNTAVLAPVFSSNVLSYTAEVANATATVTVNATARFDSATIRINGENVASGADSSPIPLAVGDNAIDTVVTGENGAQLTYSVNITRLAPPSTNANLEALGLTLVDFDQIFDPALLSYTASAGNFGSSTEVVATPEDAAATLTLDGAALAPGSASDLQYLTTGVNDFSIAVTAEDGTTTRSYVIELTRLPLGAVTQEAYVKASNSNETDYFGTALAAADATLLVGAPGEKSAATGIDGDETDTSLANAGAGYLFGRQGDVWSQTAYVKASNTDSGDFFGSAVALAGDQAVVGAPSEASSARGINGDQLDNSGDRVGAGYVFERAGSAWAQTAYLKASNADDRDQFGGALALVDSVLVGGSRYEDSAASGVNGDQGDNSLSNAGAAYLFTQSADGDWQQNAYLKASNPDSADEFGASVAVSSDLLAVGAPFEDSSATGIDGDGSNNAALDSGAVYLFRHADGSGVTPGSYLKASNTDPGDQFGTAVAIAGDLLAVGAPGEDSNASGVNGDQSDDSSVDSGAVYLFERAGDGSWAQIAYVKASNTETLDGFGVGVALRGNLLVVGSRGESSGSSGINGDQNDESQPGAGAVYVFERNDAGVLSQIAYVKASNPDEGDSFGYALAIDGDRVIAGAPQEQSNARGVNGNESDNSLNAAGAVYVIR